MRRREFLQQAGLVTTWLGVSVVLAACSDSDDPAGPGDVTGAGDVRGVIGANHGHSVQITSAQISAGNAVTLGFSGGGHAHSISLTAQQVSDIGAGRRVQGTSTSGAGHSHGVTFN